MGRTSRTGNAYIIRFEWRHILDLMGMYDATDRVFGRELVQQLISNGAPEWIGDVPRRHYPGGIYFRGSDQGMGKKRQNFLFTLTIEQHRWLQEMARNTDRSMAEIVREALIEYAYHHGGVDLNESGK